VLSGVIVAAAGLRDGALRWALAEGDTVLTAWSSDGALLEGARPQLTLASAISATTTTFLMSDSRMCCDTVLPLLCPQGANPSSTVKSYHRRPHPEPAVRHILRLGRELAVLPPNRAL